MLSRHIIKNIFLAAVVFMGMSCSGSDSTGNLSAPSALAIDSTNDRLFIAQAGGELLVFSASDYSEIGDETPLVSEDNQEEINAIMPPVTISMAVYANGTASRLFLVGGIPNDSEEIVFNQITVLDFDGATFTEASFSPITISDGDDATDDSNDAISSLALDQEGATLFVSNSSSGKIHVINMNDGSESRAALDVAGVPMGIALADGRLFVCNASDTADENVITVFNTTDFSSTTIDIDSACDLLAVTASQGAVLLMVNHYLEQLVSFYSVSETFDSVTAIPTSDTDSFEDGGLVAAKGLSSVVGGLSVTVASDGTIHGYVGVQDGYLVDVSFASGLASFDAELLATSGTNLGMQQIYLDTVTGFGNILYVIAEEGSLLLLEVGSTDVDLKN